METKIHEIKNHNPDIRINELREILLDNSIRVSHQRILILDYLVENDTHPTADQIYKDVKAIDPVISQATVYNTLNLFADKKIIKELDFNMASKRYEFTKQSHGHFICEKCGSIIDFDVTDHDHPEQLKDYELNTIEIIYRGLCPDCK